MPAESMISIRLQFLLAERSELSRMLERMPADATIDRASTVVRINMLGSEIERLEQEPEEPQRNFTQQDLLTALADAIHGIQQLPPDFSLTGCHLLLQPGIELRVPKVKFEEAADGRKIIHGKYTDAKYFRLNAPPNVNDPRRELFVFEMTD